MESHLCKHSHRTHHQAAAALPSLHIPLPHTAHHHPPYGVCAEALRAFIPTAHCTTVTHTNTVLQQSGVNSDSIEHAMRSLLFQNCDHTSDCSVQCGIGTKNSEIDALGRIISVVTHNDLGPQYIRPHQLHQHVISTTTIVSAQRGAARCAGAFYLSQSPFRSPSLASSPWATRSQRTLEDASWRASV